MDKKLDKISQFHKLTFGPFCFSKVALRLNTIPPQVFVRDTMMDWLHEGSSSPGTTVTRESQQPDIDLKGLQNSLRKASNSSSLRSVDLKALSSVWENLASDKDLQELWTSRSSST